MFINKTFKYFSFIAIVSMCLFKSFVCYGEYTIKSYFESNMPSGEIIKEMDCLLNKKGINLIFNYFPHNCLSSRNSYRFNNFFVSFDDNNHVVGCCIVSTLLPHFLTIEALVIKDYNLIDKIGNALIREVENFAEDSKVSAVVLQPTSTSIDFFKNLGYDNKETIFPRMIKYFNQK